MLEFLKLFLIDDKFDENFFSKIKNTHLRKWLSIKLLSLDFMLHLHIVIDCSLVLHNITSYFIFESISNN